MWDKSPVLFADVVTKVAANRVKEASTDMLTALVDKMPVDTSRAVSNINVSLDSPNWSFTESKYVGRSGSLSSGLSVINRLPVDKLHSLHFTSAVPYMKYLERGHSNFAPNGVFLVSFMGVAAWYR